MKKYTLEELKKISDSIPLDTPVEPYYSERVNPSPKQTIEWFLNYLKEKYEKTS